MSLLRQLLYSKTLQAQKGQNAYKQIKIKNAPQKTSKGKVVTYSLICVFMLLPECLYAV